MSTHHPLCARSSCSHAMTAGSAAAASCRFAKCNASTKQRKVPQQSLPNKVERQNTRGTNAQVLSMHTHHDTPSTHTPSSLLSFERSSHKTFIPEASHLNYARAREHNNTQQHPPKSSTRQTTRASIFVCAYSSFNCNFFARGVWRAPSDFRFRNERVCWKLLVLICTYCFIYFWGSMHCQR